MNYPMLVLLTGAVFIISFHRGSPWQQSLDSLSPVPPAEQALYKSLRQDMGEPEGSLSVLITAPTREGALQAGEALEPALESLRDKGSVASMSSPASLLPSEAAQRNRQAAVPGADLLSASLQRAAVGLPFSPGLFAPFLADAEAARHAALITPETYAGTDLGLELQSQLFQTGTDWNAVITMTGVSDPAAFRTLIGRRGSAAIAVMDMKAQSARLLATYRTEALTLAAAGSGAIALLLLATLRSPRRTARVLLPLVVSVTVTFAAVLLVAGSLSIFHLFGLLLTVAVGSNYCLFLERSTGGEERGRTLSALMLANLCTVIGFGVLSLSSVPVLQGIGSTVALGALLSLLCGLALIKPRDVA